MIETELEMVERHVRDGENRVSRQHEIIAQLRDEGRNTDLSETFEATLVLHRQHLELAKG